MKITLIEDKLKDLFDDTYLNPTNVKIGGEGWCRFAQKDAESALVAVANKIKEMKDTYGPFKIRIYDIYIDGDRITWYWSRKLSVQEMKAFKQGKATAKDREKKRQVLDLKKRAKLFGLTISKAKKK